MRYSFFFSVAALFVGAHCHSGEGVQAVAPPLEELIVLASRSQTSEQALAYSVHQLDAEALAQKLPRNLPEALADLPGVLVQKTANGQGSPFLRGFTGYRTLALIDGVRYNNSVYRDGPNEYFSLIDASSLANIELLSGPASSLYGSDAIGGTLSLLTQRADYETEFPGDFFVRGRQHIRSASAEHSISSRTELQLGQGQRWGLQLGYSLKDFGDVKAADIGEQPHTGYGEYAYDARLDVSLSHQWSLTALHQTLAQDDVWRTHSTVYAVPFAGPLSTTTAGTDLRRLKDQRRSLSYVKLAGQDLDNLWAERATLTASFQQWDEDGERVKGNGDRIVEGFDSRMWGLDLQLGRSFMLNESSSLQLSYGADFYRDNVDSERTDCKVLQSAADCVETKRIQGPVGDNSRFDQWGAYAQAELPLGEFWLLMAGSRYSQVSASIGAFEDPNSGLSASFSDHWSSQVNSLRVSFALSESQRVWAGVSESFRAPNIADLSRFGKSRSSETEVAATSLTPETFLTYELGFKQRGERFDIAATVYHTRIKDFIASTPTGRTVDGLTEVSKQNAGRGFVQGIELDASYWLSEHWRLAANFTWLEGELSAHQGTEVLSLADAALTTEPMSRIMPMTTSVQLQWRDMDRWAQLDVRGVAKADKLSSGDKSDDQRIPPGGTPGYVLLNLSAGQQLSESVRIDLALNNLLDEAYRSHGSGSNEPGRGVVLGLEVSF